MLIDGRSLSDGDVIEADVAVVGAGPAGISVALGLERHGSVCLLESGGLEIEAPAQALLGGESVGYPYHDLRRTRVRAFGGSSRHWPLTTTGGDEGWLARPFDPIDFQERAGIPGSGWPISRADLDPWYERAGEIAGLDPMPWEGEARMGDGRAPGRDHSAASPTPVPVDLGPDIVTRVFQRVPRSFLVHRPAIANSSTISLVHHATVIELVPEGARRVARLRVQGRAGTSFSVAARHVVLACGGIDNARMLLLAQRASGMPFGNAHDLVGRYFMERLSARSGVIVPSQVPAPWTPFYLSHFEGQTRIQGTLSLSDAVIREERLLNGTFFLIPRSQAFASEGTRSAITLLRGLKRRPWIGATGGHVRNLILDADQLARLTVERFRPGRSRAEVLLVGAQAEQAPNPDSRITLGERLDPLGQPEPIVDWRLTAADRASIGRSQARLDQALRRSGLGRFERPMGTEDPEALFIASFHHMGTTRMAERREDGVVDPDGRVHGLDNLYVAGSSVFPTSGFANPTLTIVALAARLSDHLVTTMAGDAPVAVVGSTAGPVA